MVCGATSYHVDDDGHDATLLHFGSYFVFALAVVLFCLVCAVCLRLLSSNLLRFGHLLLLQELVLISCLQTQAVFLGESALIRFGFHLQAGHSRGPLCTGLMGRAFRLEERHRQLRAACLCGMGADMSDVAVLQAATMNVYTGNPKDQQVQATFDLRWPSAAMGIPSSSSWRAGR